MARIKIETGIKVYEIENENGELLGTIKFNPNDINNLKRLDEFEQKSYDIDAYVRENAKEDITEDEAKEIILEADRRYKEAFDIMFGTGSSKAVFGSQNVFNELNGKTYVERFIDAILPVIKADADARNEKVNKYLEVKNEV